MTELCEDLNDRIIEAASRGDHVEGAEALSGLLTALHSPATPAELTGLPAEAAEVLAPSGPARRFAFRTGVAATAAVLGLAGTAAALTGGLVLLEPVLPDGGTTVSAVADAGVVESSVVDDDEGGEGSADGTDNDDGGGEAEASEVDGSDGLSEEELAELCEAAENHGEYVSAVARDRAGDGESSHGERVREAAASDCGKTADGTDDDDGGGEAEASEADASDGLSEEELAELCEAAENHGEYVSAVARDRAGDGESSHGERVREAAASDCGKAAGEPDDGAASEVEDDEGGKGKGKGRSGEHGQGGPGSDEAKGRP